MEEVPEDSGNLHAPQLDALEGLGEFFQVHSRLY